MKKRIVVLFSCGILSFCYFSAFALEERIEDLSASVEVAPVFSLSLDNPNLVFGSLGPGKEEILGKSRFFNEIRCRCNSGRSWYLKASLASLRMVEKDYVLPTINLKYRIVESTGSSMAARGQEFKEFSDQPILIYVSEGDDNRGKEVILRFQYSLSTPGDAPAGNYIGQIVFTMTESP